MLNYLAATTNNDGNAYPDTKAVNSSGPGTTDGTEYIKALLDDQWGANQALLNYTDDTPDGNAEEDGASQRLDSLLKIVSNIDTESSTTSYTVEEWNKRGVLICAAGVGTITIVAGTGVDQTNRVLVYNQAGATIIVDKGALTETLIDGTLAEYIYDGTSEWVRIVKDSSVLNINAVSAATFTTDKDDAIDVIEVDSTSNAVDITIDGTGMTVGTQKIIKVVTHVSLVRVLGTIDGETNFAMNNVGDFLHVYWNGTEWKKLGFEASYVTNANTYIPATDWTNRNLGTDATLNADSSVTHNLNVSSDNLAVSLKVSSDATEANTTEVFSTSSSTSDRGDTLRGVDSSNLIIQTGANGYHFYNATGNGTSLTGSSSSNYKVVVRRRF